MVKYVLTNKAVEDLTKIWDYTFETWSEKQADKYYMLLIDACQEIAERAEIGKRYEEIANEISGFRAGKHIILYRSLKLQEVEILRILHSIMDLKTKMNE